MSPELTGIAMGGRTKVRKMLCTGVISLAFLAGLVERAGATPPIVDAEHERYLSAGDALLPMSGEWIGETTRVAAEGRQVVNVPVAKRAFMSNGALVVLSKEDGKNSDVFAIDYDLVSAGYKVTLIGDAYRANRPAILDANVKRLADGVDVSWSYKTPSGSKVLMHIAVSAGAWHEHDEIVLSTVNGDRRVVYEDFTLRHARN